MSYIPEAQRKTQGTGQWEELIAPIDCNYYDILAAPDHAFDKCIDLEDGGTSCFTNLISFSVKAPFFSSARGRNTRYLAGERICWVKSDSSLRIAFLV